MAHLTTVGMTGSLGPVIERNAYTYHNRLSAVIQLCYEIELARDLAFRAIVFNARHNRAGFMGSIAGGFFTNYASRLGRFGKRTLPQKVKLPAGLANFIMTRYGAGLVAMAEGMHGLDKVVTMIATGDVRAAACMPSMADIIIADGEMDDEMIQGLKALVDVVYLYMRHGDALFEDAQ